MYMSMQ